MWEKISGGFTMPTLVVGAIIGVVVVFLLRRKK